MPLNKQKLIADIITAQEKAHKAKFNVDGRAIFAREMAMAIDLFIKSGDVQTTTSGLGIVAPGIPTAGSQYAQVTVAPGTSTTTGTGVGKVV